MSDQKSTTVATSEAASDKAVVCKELFGALTAKTVDFDMGMWRDQDSSCLLCHTPIGLDDGAEWPDDPRLLLCWGCMSELCAELISKQAHEPKS
jgi:hypothetical protein